MFVGDGTGRGEEFTQIDISIWTHRTMATPWFAHGDGCSAHLSVDDKYFDRKNMILFISSICVQAFVLVTISFASFSIGVLWFWCFMFYKVIFDIGLYDCCSLKYRQRLFHQQISKVWETSRPRFFFRFDNHKHFIVVHVCIENVQNEYIHLPQFILENPMNVFLRGLLSALSAVAAHVIIGIGDLLNISAFNNVWEISVGCVRTSIFRSNLVLIMPDVVEFCNEMIIVC